jgi:hypothetical protein
LISQQIARSPPPRRTGLDSKQASNQIGPQFFWTPQHQKSDISMIDRTRLTVTFAVTLALCGCSLITPPDEGYFRTHAKEARLIVTRCERGQESGNDCKAAARAVAALDKATKDASAKGVR